MLPTTRSGEKEQGNKVGGGLERQNRKAQDRDVKGAACHIRFFLPWVVLTSMQNVGKGVE